MPLYVFENPALGARIELPFAIADRPDEIVLKRKTVPDRIAVAGHAVDEYAAASDLAACYKRAEERGLLDPRTRGQGMTDAERKHALSLPPIG